MLEPGFLSPDPLILEASHPNALTLPAAHTICCLTTPAAWPFRDSKSVMRPGRSPQTKDASLQKKITPRLTSCPIGEKYKCVRVSTVFCSSCSCNNPVLHSCPCLRRTLLLLCPVLLFHAAHTAPVQVSDAAHRIFVQSVGPQLADFPRRARLKTTSKDVIGSGSQYGRWRTSVRYS